jgi:hypothetical protein
MRYFNTSLLFLFLITLFLLLKIAIGLVPYTALL